MIDRDLRAEREQLQRRLDALDAAIREAELRRPAEPPAALAGETVVLTFVKHFGNPESDGYIYAAVSFQTTIEMRSRREWEISETWNRRVYGAVVRPTTETVTETRWAVTGRERRRDSDAMTWTDVVDFIVSNEGEFAQHALDSITFYSVAEESR